MVEAVCSNLAKGVNRVLYWLPLFEPLFHVGRTLGEQNRAQKRFSDETGLIDVLKSVCVGY